MKVAILTAVDIHANNGGVESYLRNYIAHRKKHGDEITVISTKGKVRGSIDLFWRTLTFAFKRHDLREYDQVITNTHSIQLFIKSGKTISIWHGSDLQRFHEDWRAFISPFTYLDAFLEIIDLFLAPVICPVSKHTSKFINSGIWKREFSDDVMYPLVNKNFMPMPQDKICDNRVRILFVGNPKNKRKGFTLMLKALRLLPQDFSLIVCGGDRVGMKYEGKHIVEYMGLIENEQMPRFYSMCDCYCLPTTYEGTPMTVVEAIACKCPVVATRVGGIPEVVVDGENGYIAEPNAKDIAKKILLAYNMEVR